jgi:hypothetical protein
MKKTAHQIASHVLTKVAAITDDEIAAGLAGNKLRDIPQEEIDSLTQEYGDKAYKERASAPWWGGGLGGALGGLGGLALSQGRPAGGLIGLGIGGGLGALLGHGVRTGARSQARDLGSTVGGIAQSGRIPYDFPGRVRTDDLIPYAKGTQGTPEPMNFQDEQSVRDRLTNRLMLLRGAEGAVTGGLSSALSNRDREDASGDAMLNAAIQGGVGTLRGRSEAREMARKVLDLKSRGYGTLSDRYYNDALDPTILGY